MDVPFLVLFINFVVLLAKRGFNLFIFSEILIRCGHVVRDFESEAKTR